MVSRFCSTAIGRYDFPGTRCEGKVGVERGPMSMSGKPATGHPSIPALPVPTKGPFSLDMDELFGQASAAVRSRADIVDQLETLQDPPDLRLIVGAQQRFLTAEIAGQVGRCT